MIHELPAFAWSRCLMQGILLLSVLIPLLAIATGSVRLTWNPSTDPSVAGYKIYYGVASRAYTDAIPVGNTTNVTISNLVDGTTYYFAATAYNALGQESPFSNEAVYTIPLTPTNYPPSLVSPSYSNGRCSFTVSGVPGYQYVVEMSTNLVNWIPVATNTVPFTFVVTNTSQFHQQFYRAAYFP
jgi:Fibronectin type III domain